jgi:hypothetical protein
VSAAAERVQSNEGSASATTRPEKDGIKDFNNHLQHTSIHRQGQKPLQLPRWGSPGTDSSISVEQDDREIKDRDVLRGLHIIASAACDEEVDAFIRHKTGLRLRHLLADLMALETLGEEDKIDEREMRLRRKRIEQRRLRKMREQERRSRQVMAGR